MKIEPNRLTSNIMCALALSFAVAAWPATNTVTSSASGGVGSLPDVIGASMEGDTIVFAITGSIPLTRELSVDKSLTIAGPGASVLAITGSGENRIFNITASATVRISDLTLREGHAPAGEDGGAIFNAGNLTVSTCVIADNFAGSSFNLADRPGGSGGGIYNLGQLWVEDSVITGNRAGAGASGANQHLYGNPGWDGGNGGGICSEGWMSIARSTVSNNFAGSGGSGGFGQVGGGHGGTGGAGGGIFALTSVIERCTVAGNIAGGGGTGGSSSAGAAGGGIGGSGGGIYGTVLIANCTIVGNSAGGGGDGGMRTSYPTGQAGGGSGGDGGGLRSGNSTNQFIVSCTVAGNSAGYGGWGGSPEYPNPGSRGSGGGVASITLARGSLLNNIIAGNTIGSSPDVSGTFRSLGYNLVGITNGSSDFNAFGDLTGSSESPLDPKLAPLTNNGGTTMTMALVSNSPAINAGTSLNTPVVDQRGILRPQGLRTDIGAYEYQFSIPQITRVKSHSPARFWLEACGMPNEIYAVQTSTDLTNWTDLIGVVTSSNGMCEIVDLGINFAPARFYRLALPPP